MTDLLSQNKIKGVELQNRDLCSKIKKGGRASDNCCILRSRIRSIFASRFGTTPTPVWQSWKMNIDPWDFSRSSIPNRYLKLRSAPYIQRLLSRQRLYSLIQMRYSLRNNSFLYLNCFRHRSFNYIYIWIIIFSILSSKRQYFLCCMCSKSIGLLHY